MSTLTLQDTLTLTPGEILILVKLPEHPKAWVQLGDKYKFERTDAQDPNLLRVTEEATGRNDGMFWWRFKKLASEDWWDIWMRED
jgi:hypothetical protein